MMRAMKQGDTKCRRSGFETQKAGKRSGLEVGVMNARSLRRAAVKERE